MLAAKQSSFGTRRRTAMWLVAAWLVLGVSQAYAACCAPVAGGSVIPTHAAAVLPGLDESAAHDCCESVEQPCQLVIDAAPPAAPVAGLVASGQIQHPDVLRVQFALRPAAAASADGQARVPIPPALSGPIYLRMQRFLI